MIFSRQTGYAIRALVHLAQNMNSGAVLASAIAKTENLPALFYQSCFAIYLQTASSTRGKGREADSRFCASLKR